MKLIRRDCLRLGALAGTGTLLSGCSSLIRHYTPPPLAPTIALPPGDTEPISRLIKRVSFGPIPGEVERVTALGAARYVEEQLNPDESEALGLTLRLRSIEAFHEDAIDLRDMRENEMLLQLQQAAILHAVYSQHQLRERLVDFWGNHFNIYARKGNSVYFKPLDELSVIRQHALGTFPDLLRASAHSPAMLGYLDNQVNQRGVANENYARELMELHTLGVHGGYTQKDVQEVARCLTGWTIEDRFLRRRGTFRFDESHHDTGTKTVLGVTIPEGGGQNDGEQVLTILAHHPATAHFIAGKLCRYFLSTADSPWTAKLAAIYLQTGGDIRAMLRPLLLSSELLRAPPIIKRPFDFMVSALRALNADTDGGAGAQDHLARMGQPLYQWPMPDGYPDRTSAWTGSLLARWNFALNLTAGEVKGTVVKLPALIEAAGLKSGAASNAASTDALIALILTRHASATTLQTLRADLLTHMDSLKVKDHQAQAEVAALLLAAPQFQWR